MNDSWGLSNVWNAALEGGDERPLVERDYLWASELGRSPIDVWLKTRATPYSNPANSRSKRKFEAGNVFEWIVSLVLKRSGILTSSQKYCSFQYPGLMKVTGKMDFIAGGIPDPAKFEAELAPLELPPVFIRAGRAVVEWLATRFPNGLEEMPLEIKSTSSFAFDAMEAKGRSNKPHRLQTFHYLKSENMPKGHIVYICRDDLRIQEFPVYMDSNVEQEYRAAIELFSGWKDSPTPPPAEKDIVFDEDFGRFSRNFNVAYSPYLTLVYGIKDQREYEERVKSTVGKWNRVVARIKAGKDMTKKNSEVLQEIQISGYDIEEIKAKFPAVPVEEEEGE